MRVVSTKMEWLFCEKCVPSAVHGSVLSINGRMGWGGARPVPLAMQPLLPAGSGDRLDRGWGGAM